MHEARAGILSINKALSDFAADAAAIRDDKKLSDIGRVEALTARARKALERIDGLKATTGRLDQARASAASKAAPRDVFGDDAAGRLKVASTIWPILPTTVLEAEAEYRAALTRGDAMTLIALETRPQAMPGAIPADRLDRLRAERRHAEHPEEARYLDTIDQAIGDVERAMRDAVAELHEAGGIKPDDVVIKTSKGNVRIALDPERKP